MILYLLGIDGAGKTTLGRRLAAAEWHGKKVRYIYCQHRPFILWLAKLPARLLWLRNNDQFRNYAEYRSRKRAAANLRPRLARLYAFLWCLDAWLQTWPRIQWARLRADVIIVDRYYLDWIVNLAVLQDSASDDMLERAKALERFLPKPQLLLFLDLDTATAMVRKDDIPSELYLIERRARYLDLITHFDCVVVDAGQDQSSVYQQVLTALEESRLLPSR